MRTNRHSLRVTLMLALIALLLNACASPPSAEPPQLVQCPRPAPLPAAILQIDSQPSTRTLSAGQAWLQDSELILDGATQR